MLNKVPRHQVSQPQLPVVREDVVAGADRPGHHLASLREVSLKVCLYCHLEFELPPDLKVEVYCLVHYWKGLVGNKGIGA